MHILFLNGSPKKHGLLSQMIGIMKQEAEHCGVTVNEIRTYDLNIQSCCGCMTCRTSRTCKLPEDNVQQVATLIQQADALVVASPCYWGNMSGTLKQLFDRIFYVLIKESERGIPQPLQKGKKALIITTCSTPFPFNRWFHQSSGTVSRIKEILRWSGYRVKGTIQRAGTKKNNQLTANDRTKCHKLIHKIIQTTL